MGKVQWDFEQMKNSAKLDITNENFIEAKRLIDGLIKIKSQMDKLRRPNDSN